MCSVSTHTSEVSNEWRYTSTPSIHLYGVHRQISFKLTLRSSLFRDVTQPGLVISYWSFGNFSWNTWPFNMGRQFVPSRQKLSIQILLGPLKFRPISFPATSVTTKIPWVRSQKSDYLIYTVAEACNPTFTFRDKITYVLNHEEICSPVCDAV